MMAQRALVLCGLLCPAASAFVVGPAIGRPGTPHQTVCGLLRPVSDLSMNGDSSSPGSIQEQLKARMKTAMKAGPGGKAELSAVRLMVAALTTKSKEDGVEALADDAAVAALSKLAKMRKESIEMFEGAGKTDMADAEKFELAILEEYLPAMADEATVRGWIATAIETACPDGPDKKLMGKVMGALMKEHKGEFDGKEANKWVAEMLSPA